MNPTEKLLTKILNKLSEHVREDLVLKGGMLLRLYNSPRSTRDIDFVWLSKESKKNLKPRLETALSEIENLAIERLELNSRGIFIDVVDVQEDTRAELEISVKPSLNLPSEPMSTVELARPYALAGRIVSTMAMPEAFAHKIAATLERDVVRDFFDLSQMENITTFDLPTLKFRLNRLEISRGKPRSYSFSEAGILLKKKLQGLDQEKIETELFPLLSEQFQMGVLPIIRVSVGRIAQRLETLTDELVS